MSKKLPDPSVILTRAQFARILGVRPDHVTRWVQAGMPGVLSVGAGRGIETTIDAVAAMKWWREHNDQRSRKDKTIADLNEFKLATLKREFLPAEQVEAEGLAVTTAIRARLRSLGRRLLQDGVIDPAGLPAVERIVEEALGELARWRPDGEAA
jgi:phage terminase Nu1 subunit (DNA packaging protein)